MFALNLRQKMIGCFCLHLLFYIIVGITFLKDFNMFNDDVTLLMHAGNLSNISLEIRRYEKNFIIRHDNTDFNKVLEYVDEAQQFVPQVIDDLQIMPHPTHLQDLTAKLTAYEETFKEFKGKCTIGQDVTVCPLREKVRSLGQELVNITEDLVLFEQNKMTVFIEKFTIRLINTVLFLVLLSVFTISLLYTSIVKPLKKVENAAIDIANGTFSRLSVDDKKGEVRSVLRAFNKMVTDLEEQQEQLFQAKKLSSIGTLASGTAHQINNPLNNISTSCQLALANMGDDKDSFVARMLKTIDQETQRAGEIVRGLLEFSRAHTFSSQPCQLAKIVNKVKLLVASEIPTGINIETDIPEDVVLYVDVQKMVEALLNLTINAIQAIPEPPGTVCIKAEKDEEQKKAVITVADTGTGIDPENLAKVFDPFFTTKTAGNGTGLGLAVVYGIIKKQGGSIRVESTKGTGTNFIITLPLHSEPAETMLPGKYSTSRGTNV
ncbi:HAMP domain-containing histidine kinase [Desulfocapsa sulfexigens DSM 10523]|uniref:histidine kinase n=1 Tax=Desulfocapsa sulfexigens (strain DSM 10523 / SB164P1) TaxID=1167006 RepID=M1PS13_DESSD|nr:HAMP domain-containing sensor histidine kinase [Desulfocapsa sulfexigens]AGF79151.1 HAMP domain-containing histidine kinase [Desulfocapsa sulfexigens DSM 10523]